MLLPSQVIFRVNAGSQTGLGHFMRCLALAEALQAKGTDIIFTGNCNLPLVSKKLQALNIPLIPFESNESSAFLDHYPPKENSWVVMDGYFFMEPLALQIKKSGYRLLMVEDYIRLNRYVADIVVNPNIGAEKLKYQSDSGTLFRQGLDYVFLRQEYLTRKSQHPAKKPSVENLLITLGGSDTTSYFPKILKALDFLHESCNVRIVGTEAVRELKEFKDSKLKDKMELLPLVEDYPSLLHWADLALTAGGSTCWELSYLGVPFVTLILAENQAPIAEGLSERKAAMNAGWITALEPGRLEEILKRLFRNPEERALLLNNASALVDGKGVERIIGLMSSF